MKNNYLVQKVAKAMLFFYYLVVYKFKFSILNFLYNNMMKKLRSLSTKYNWYLENKKDNIGEYNAKTIKKFNIIIYKYSLRFLSIHNEKFYNQVIKFKNLLGFETLDYSKYLKIEEKYRINHIFALKYKVQLILNFKKTVKETENYRGLFETLKEIDENFIDFYSHFSEVEKFYFENTFEYKEVLKKVELNEKKNFEENFEEINSKTADSIYKTGLNVSFLNSFKMIIKSNSIKNKEGFDRYFKNHLGIEFNQSFFEKFSKQLKSNTDLLRSISKLEEKVALNRNPYHFELDSAFKDSYNYETYISLDEALEIIKQALSPLGNEYLTKLNRGIDLSYSNLINITKKNTKFLPNVAGWIKYDKKKKDYVIHVNYNPYSIESLFTLAHELGHYCDSNRTKTVKGAVEINSIFAELMVYNYLKEQRKDDFKFLFKLKKEIYSKHISDKLKRVMDLHFKYLVYTNILEFDTPETLNLLYSKEFLGDMFFDVLNSYYDNHYIEIGNSNNNTYIQHQKHFSIEVLSPLKYFTGFVLANYIVSNIQNEEFKNSYLNLVNKKLDGGKLSLKNYLEEFTIDDITKLFPDVIDFFETEVNSFISIIDK